jgi:hypothetical protein
VSRNVGCRAAAVLSDHEEPGRHHRVGQRHAGRYAETAADADRGIIGFVRKKAPPILTA